MIKTKANKCKTCNINPTTIMKYPERRIYVTYCEKCKKSTRPMDQTISQSVRRWNVLTRENNEISS